MKGVDPAAAARAILDEEDRGFAAQVAFTRERGYAVVRWANFPKI